MGNPYRTHRRSRQTRGLDDDEFARWRTRGRNQPRGNGAEGDERRMTAAEEKRAFLVSKLKRDNAQNDAFGFRDFATLGGADVDGESHEREAFLYNMHATHLIASDGDESAPLLSALAMYFTNDDGEVFRAIRAFRPYLLLRCAEPLILQVRSLVQKQHEKEIASVEIIDRLDLDQKNHLSGLRRRYLKISTLNQEQLLRVRRALLPLIERNQKEKRHEAFEGEGSEIRSADAALSTLAGDLTRALFELREYDYDYVVRAAIDLDIRVGKWFIVRRDPADERQVLVSPHPSKEMRPDLRVMAFDIETTKPPLKFPDPEKNRIMMLSYMTDGQGYLLVNREVVSEDINDFDYTPKPEYPGAFIVHNLPTERALLQHWFEHIREAPPLVYATYNGDFFDWPFIERRAKEYDMVLREEIGVWCESRRSGNAKTGNQKDGEYMGRFSVHIDCLCWVKRDSYLPQGSQSLKVVTVKKLGYNPVELDPELMVPYAYEKPQELSTYSVSDALATYHLYMKYVHLFIFSLCNVIPMPAADVLRKGSGTLCESLLMVQAADKEIVAPNKQVDTPFQIRDGRVLENETYIGGHVECMESGVFREDIPMQFRIVPAAVQELMDELDECLKFTLEVEEKVALDTVANYDEVYNKIRSELQYMRDNPKCTCTPLLYHLDVSAMYPNIILTNRLQPAAIVDDETCAQCVYNDDVDAHCKRDLTWKWRGSYYTLSKGEFKMIRTQLMTETFPTSTMRLDSVRLKEEYPTTIPYLKLPEKEKQRLLQDRVKAYSQKTYKRVTKTEERLRTSRVCQRENAFYVDTVRNFRDRRYDYKKLTRTWKIKKEEARDDLESRDCAKMVTLYDSLQLAHKCILNSFYGYMMRRGARWFSMPAAAITTYTGAEIIKDARILCEQLGRPLELDTDGIWVALPSHFPEDFVFTLTNGKKLKISYPCSMLNVRTHRRFSNLQHQEWDPVAKRYRRETLCTIYFEVDGPYRCMLLPASPEEGKTLKKRYVVYNRDGSLAELKGFELKRRGELQIIKLFQQEVFPVFMHGSTLLQCYESVAKIADRWLDILIKRGSGLSKEQLFELIAEKKNMSGKLADYAGQRSTAITCARRLGECLGAEMIADTSRLQCHFIVAAKPHGLQVSERVVPLQIFDCEPKKRRHFLRKWLQDPGAADDALSPHAILDWDYYLRRLGACIQKVIVIPAAMQKVSNPVPRVEYPAWLAKRLREADAKFKQQTLGDRFGFKRMNKTDSNKKRFLEIEDIGRAKRVSSSDTDSVKAEKKELEPVKPKNVAFPPSNEDHLKQLRALWAFQRAQRRSRVSVASSDDVFAGAASGAAGHKKRARADGSNGGVSLFSSDWTVLGIVPEHPRGRESGDFLFFVTLGNHPRMHRVRVRVQRQFYVNTDGQLPELAESGELVRHKVILPRGRPQLHLLRFDMPEQEFQAAKEHLAALTHNPHVEGLYETRVPLDLQLLLRVGAKVRVARDVTPSQRHRRHGFLLDELTRAGTGDTVTRRLLTTAQSILVWHTRVTPLISLTTVAAVRTDTDTDGGAADTAGDTAIGEKRELHVHVVVTAEQRAVFRKSWLQEELESARSMRTRQFDALLAESEQMQDDPLDEQFVSDLRKVRAVLGTFAVANVNVTRAATQEERTAHVDAALAALEVELGLSEVQSSASLVATASRPTFLLLFGDDTCVSAQWRQRWPVLLLPPSLTSLLQLRLPEGASLDLCPDTQEDVLGDASVRAATKRMAHVLCSLLSVGRLDDDLYRAAEAADKAALPIGLMPLGSERQARVCADLALARQLQSQRHLLWSCATSQADFWQVGDPWMTGQGAGGRMDLGGTDSPSDWVTDVATLSTGGALVDVTRLAQCERMQQSQGATKQHIDEEMEDGKHAKVVLHSGSVVSHSGCYRRVCAEIAVRDLAVNCVLLADVLDSVDTDDDTEAADTATLNMHSMHVNAKEETVSGRALRKQTQKWQQEQRKRGASLEALLPSENAAAALPSFAALRLVLRRWMKRHISSECPFSLRLLREFAQWLQGGADGCSWLQEPQLRVVVERLQKRCLYLLVTQLKKLGVRVINATSTHLLVATSRTSLEAAQRNVAFCLNALRQHECFAWLTLEPRRWYTSLVYLDSSNFGGLCVSDTDGEGTQETVLQGTWSLCDHFDAPSCRQQFLRCLDVFLRDPCDFLDKLEAGDEEAIASVPNLALSLQQRAQHADVLRLTERDRGAALSEFLGAVFWPQWARRLTRVVDLLQQRAEDDEKDDLRRLVVLLCQVMSLDTALLDACSSDSEQEAGVEEANTAAESVDVVTQLKASLLRLIGLRIHQAAARFVYPPAALKLRHVPCRTCETVVDLALLPSSASDAAAESEHGSSGPVCQVCHSALDTELVEDRLLQLLRALMACSQQTEARCSKTNRAQLRELSPASESAAPWTLLPSRDAIDYALTSMRKVADSWQLTWLRNALEQVHSA
ncbi:MAG: hypothetical protein MHM6MM_001764 [Cercozoa sp. M6MM]